LQMRSIQVSSNNNLTNGIEICRALRSIPDTILKDHFLHLLRDIRSTAEIQQNKTLLDWLDHKRANRWILTCVSRATTGMSHSDWYSTNSSTNIAESAHAQSHREGKNLTLVSAVQSGQKLDLRQFELERAAHSFGIASKYGNSSMTGRAKKNSIRQRKTQVRMNEKEKSTDKWDWVLKKAEKMKKQGISQKVIDDFVSSHLLSDTSSGIL
jgi:hypothetical protein